MALTHSFIVGGKELIVHGLYQDSKPKLATKLIADGRHVTFVGPNGKLYSSRVQHSTRYYGNRWHGHLALIKEAIALGALPKSNVLRIAKIEEARRARQNQAYSAKDALSSASAAGVTLPATVTRALQRKARAA